jgi:hypothetical protein
MVLYKLLIRLWVSFPLGVLLVVLQKPIGLFILSELVQTSELQEFSA